MEPVGLVEIAKRLDVPLNTVQVWRKRGRLPAPSWTVSGAPAWDWFEVKAWAQASGREQTVTSERETSASGTKIATTTNLLIGDHADVKVSSRRGNKGYSIWFRTSDDPLSAISFTATPEVLQSTLMEAMELLTHELDGE